MTKELYKKGHKTNDKVLYIESNVTNKKNNRKTNRKTTALKLNKIPMNKHVF